MTLTTQSAAALALLAGGLTGGALFLCIAAIRGLPVRPPDQGPSRLERALREAYGPRGLVAVLIGGIVLFATRWVVAGIAIALLAYTWKGLGGAASERAGMARLEALATWTESLRDTIAGAVGLEAAIPASIRVADTSIQGPLLALVDRLHTRVPMHEALRRFAEELADPSSDLIISALIINSRLRGPGLRDLLGSLAASVREELDMRRRVNAQRQGTRRSAQVVIAISVGLAIGLAIFDKSLLSKYDSVLGQLVLAVVCGLYAAGVIWLRKLATFEQPERLLGRVGKPTGQDDQGGDGDAIWSPARGPATGGRTTGGRPAGGMSGGMT
jgi:Flp pilus assembly protein TadB